MRMLKFIIGISFVYIIFSIVGVIYFGIPLELIQFCWLIVIAAPWYNKRLANFLKYKRFWD